MSQKIAAALTHMFTIFNRKDDGELLKAYLYYLKDYGEAESVDAIIKATASAQYMPVPAVLLALLQPQDDEMMRYANNAAESFLCALRTGNEACTKDDKISDYLCRNEFGLSGMISRNTTEVKEEPFLRARFLKSYMEIAKNPRLRKEIDEGEFQPVGFLENYKPAGFMKSMTSARYEMEAGK